MGTLSATLEQSLEKIVLLEFPCVGVLGSGFKTLRHTKALFRLDRPSRKSLNRKAGHSPNQGSFDPARWGV